MRSCSTVSFDNDVKSAVSGILAGQFVAAWQDCDSDGSGGQITATVQELVRTTTGDGTSETLTGDELRDIINGNGGNDTLNGGAGNDTLNGGAGTTPERRAATTPPPMRAHTVRCGGGARYRRRRHRYARRRREPDRLTATASGSGNTSPAATSGNYAANDTLNGDRHDTLTAATRYARRRQQRHADRQDGNDT